MASLELSIRRLPDQSLAAELHTDLSSGLVTLGETLIEIDPHKLLSLSINSERYGEALSAMVFPTPLDTAWQRARGQAEGARIGLHLRVTIGDHTGDLDALRWELLRDPLTSMFLAQREGDSLTRRVLLDKADELYVVTPPAKPALRALIAVASPNDGSAYGLAQVNAADEAERARQALGDIPAILLADTTPGSRKLATLENIKDGLRDGVHLLFLVCHGQQTEEGTTILYFVDANGNAAPITGAVLEAEIKALDARHRPLLVVLLACESASQNNVPLASVGPLLARAGIPAVLAMQAPISMVAAAQLTTRLLRELDRDGRIDRALAAARKELGSEWWVPVLWLRVSDGRLWTANIESQRHLLEQWIDRVLIAHDLGFAIDAHQLMALITACPSWDRAVTSELPHDLNRLLDSLHLFSSTSQAWHDLCSYVDEVLPQGKIARHLVYALIRDAQALRLRPLDIPWLYGRYRPPGALWEKRGQEVTSLTQLILTLAEADPAEQHHALVDLAWWLADTGEHEQSPREAVQALRDWARTTASAIGVDLPTNDACPPTVHRKQRLQLRLAPVPTGATRSPSYYLDSWLRTGDRCDPKHHHQLVGPDSIQEVLDTLLKELGPQLKRNPDTIIELFLPHSLMLLDVDRWPLAGRIRAPLGLDYRVIVRSFERSDT